MPGFNANLSSVIYIVALVVLILATARGARLVSRDDITAPIRLAIDRRWGTDSFASKLVWCPWCSGMWIALLLGAMAMTAAVTWDDWPAGLAVAAWIPTSLAIAYAGSRLVDWEDD